MILNLLAEIPVGFVSESLFNYVVGGLVAGIVALAGWVAKLILDDRKRTASELDSERAKTTPEALAERQNQEGAKVKAIQDEKAKSYAPVIDGLKEERDHWQNKWIEDNDGSWERVAEGLESLSGLRGDINDLSTIVADGLEQNDALIVRILEMFPKLQRALEANSTAHNECARQLKKMRKGGPDGS